MIGWLLPTASSFENLHIVRDVFNAPSLEMTRKRAAEVLEEYQETSPVAIRDLGDDLEACLTCLHWLPADRRAMHTTNLVEHAFRESRRRAKVIPHLFSYQVCLRLGSSARRKTSQRWRQEMLTELE